MRKSSSLKITKKKYLRKHRRPRRSYKKRKNLDPLNIGLELNKSSDIIYINNVSNKMRTNKLDNSSGNIIPGLRNL